MAKITPETSLAQSEITLAAVRDQALNALLKQGVESTYTSQAHRTDKGLEITTTNGKTHDQNTMIVNGSATGEHRALHLDTLVDGNFTISHMQNGKATTTERDKFLMSGSDWDSWWDRNDKFNLSMQRQAADGKPFQTYEPAISEEKTVNGQTVRIARSAGNDANCGMENIYNPGNHRMECDFIIHDNKLGDLSYNLTREKEASGWYYRSVVRDMQGKVLGIVSEDYKLDANGDIVSINTSARKPRPAGK